MVQKYYREHSWSSSPVCLFVLRVNNVIFKKKKKLKKRISKCETVQAQDFVFPPAEVEEEKKKQKTKQDDVIG